MLWLQCIQMFVHLCFCNQVLSTGRPPANHTAGWSGREAIPEKRCRQVTECHVVSNWASGAREQAASNSGNIRRAGKFQERSFSFTGPFILLFIAHFRCSKGKKNKIGAIKQPQRNSQASSEILCRAGPVQFWEGAGYY